MLSVGMPSIAWIYVSNFGYAVAVGCLLYVMRARVAMFWNKFAPATSSDGFVIGLIGGITVAFVLGMIGVNALAAMVGGGGAALWLPQYLARRRRQRYEEEFDSSLVESLTTISASLKAGITLRDSLGVAARNCPPAFAMQAGEVLKEYKFGLSLEEALNNVRSRVGTQNANIAFGAMIIGSQLGGNLPAVLGRIVSTVRERERVEGKLKSLTAQGRTQAALLCAAPPVLGVGMYLWDPQKMALLTDTFPGQILLCMAIGLEVIGIFATKKIMQLDI